MRQRAIIAVRTGFGLIEILVVVVIISILALIILPRLVGGKDPLTQKTITSPRVRAKQAAGSEYISQINMAIQMYRQDHEEHNPPTLVELKPYGVTEEMMLDPVTQHPLPYDPDTGRIGNSNGTAEIPNLGGGANIPQIGQ
jgi:prepilin-type N-terminal cleavage/methylation domain-containing protein